MKKKQKLCRKMKNGKMGEFKNTVRRNPFPIAFNQQHLGKKRKEERSFQIYSPQTLESHFQNVHRKEKYYLASVLHPVAPNKLPRTY